MELRPDVREVVRVIKWWGSGGPEGLGERGTRISEEEEEVEFEGIPEKDVDSWRAIEAAIREGFGVEDGEEGMTSLAVRSSMAFEGRRIKSVDPPTGRVIFDVSGGDAS